MEEFKTMDQLVSDFFSHPAFPQVVSAAYCDYIAAMIADNLKAVDAERLLSSVSRPRYDLAEDGSFLSTKKIVAVTDRYGKTYRITVEEV